MIFVCLLLGLLPFLDINSVQGQTIGQSAPKYGPLTFREKVARYRLLRGADLIQPSVRNVSPGRYLEYLKEGTVDDAQADFLSVDPYDVGFSKEREQLEGRIGDHVTLTLSKFGRYQVPALTIYTLVLNRNGHPTFVTEVINYALMEENGNEENTEKPE